MSATPAPAANGKHAAPDAKRQADKAAVIGVPIPTYCSAFDEMIPDFEAREDARKAGKPGTALPKQSDVQTGERGLKYLGLLEGPEQKLLTDTFATLKAAGVLVPDQNLYWVNFYLHGRWLDCISKDTALQSHWRRAIEGMLDRAGVYPGRHRVLSAGFLVNPAGSQRTQPWHIDYTQTASAIFVPITPQSELNATQVVESDNWDPSDIKWDIPTHSDHHPGPVRLLQQNETVKVYQVLCPPFGVLNLRPKTIHRGIANRDSYDRNMLFVQYDMRDGPDGNYFLPEATVFVPGKTEPKPFDATAAALASGDQAAAAAAAPVPKSRYG